MILSRSKPTRGNGTKTESFVGLSTLICFFRIPLLFTLIKQIDKDLSVRAVEPFSHPLTVQEEKLRAGEPPSDGDSHLRPAFN